MKLIRVTCALIVEKGKLLCAQRSATMQLPLKWELPGGKIEVNETEEDCLHREIEEELGLKIHILEKLQEELHQFDAEKSILLIPFLCHINGGILNFIEHNQVIWLGKTQLLDLDWAEADLAIVKRFIEKDFN